MEKRKTPEERYKENIRKQEKTLEEFAAHEIEWADDLLLWYRLCRGDYKSLTFTGVIKVFKFMYHWMM